MWKAPQGRSRRFFEEFQDRIMFGTDAVPGGYETPQQIFGDLRYEIYCRFPETEDEYFDYAPAPIPPQGRWRNRDCPTRFRARCIPKTPHACWI
jgi:hypothetical protein